MWSLRILALAAVVSSVCGHGRVMDPPSRATAWRFGFPTQPDYDDDGVNCGGFARQWELNRGRCGICGDAYDLKTPRPHELGGTFGEGIIVDQYQSGALITTTVQITAYHKGFWEFKLCPDPENNSQKCFDQYVLELEDGGTKYYPARGSAKYQVTYKLPSGLVCEHCVLQWRYTAGNNWGDCGNGTQAVGCGNQEHFGACSDISIGISGDDAKSSIPEDIPYPLFFYLQHGYFDVQQGLLHLLRTDFLRPQKILKPPKTRKSSAKKKRRKKKKSKHNKNKGPKSKPRKRKKVQHWW